MDRQRQKHKTQELRLFRSGQKLSKHLHNNNNFNTHNRDNNCIGHTTTKQGNWSILKRSNRNKENKDTEVFLKMGQKDKNNVCNNVCILLVGLLIGTFSLFAASSFRDFMDSLLQISVPISDKTLTGGVLFVSYRFLYFLIVLAILVTISVFLIK